MGGRSLTFPFLLFLAQAGHASAPALAASGQGLWHGSRPPAFSEVRGAFRVSEEVLLDRDGLPIQELRQDLKVRRLGWKPLSAVSPAILAAVLAAEDRRFFSHSGVDWAALAGAVLQGARSGRLRGASTVTMQVAGFLEQGLKPRNSRRKPAEKMRQMLRALALERAWSKSEILEAYLNLVAGKGEFQGIEALSQGLFGKQPHGVNGAEAAILAALLREPAASLDAVLRRGRLVARSAGWTIPEEELGKAASRALFGPRAIPPAADLAPLAARRLFADAGTQGSGGPGIRSTLKAEIQAFSAAILKERLAALAGRNVSDGAVLVADNASGEVLAYVGNSGPTASAPHVDGVTARRQAGSTLKPFLYGLAFDRRLLTPASPIEDSPIDVLSGRGVFKPENYDRRFRGWITGREALAGSVNIPAVRTLSLVGADAFVEILDRLGFQDLGSGGFYGPSLALGSADISLWDLVSAYRALAAGGISAPLRMSLRGGPPRTPRRVFSREAAWLVADILSDRRSRSATFGLESALDTRFWTAVKTGTSKDMRDNWCVGFSERYTVGVWVGNFSGAPMWNVSGVSGAAPVWQDVMNRLHARVPSRQPPAPPGLVSRKVAPLGSAEPAAEWFFSGTEPDAGRIEAAAARPRILSPVSGEVIALDPDIPAGLESVPFKASSDAGLRWRLDGRDLGPVSGTFSWPPEKGSHRLELADESGTVLDRSEFTVRGESPADRDARESGEDHPDSLANDTGGELPRSLLQ